MTTKTKLNVLGLEAQQQPPAAPEPPEPPAPAQAAPAVPAAPVVTPTEPAPAEPAPEVEPKVEPQPPAGEPAEETIEQVREHREFLLKELERMASIKPAMPVQPEAEPAKPPEEPPRPTLQTPADIFVKDDDEFDKIISSREEFNKMLSKVKEAGRQEVLTSLPKLVEPLISERVNVATRIQTFYQRNPDLYEFRSYVGAVANELQSLHADWELEKLLSETESEARKRLRVPKTNSAKPEPAFVPPPASRKQVVDTRSPVTKDVDQMLKTM